MTSLSTLPSGIRGYLDEYVVRSRRVALFRAAGLGIAFYLLWMLAWCAIDRFAQLPAAVRWSGMAVGTAGLLAVIIKPLLALRRRRDWISAANEVEQHNPRFAQRLATVTSRVLGAADYRGSDEILLRLVREVDEQVAGDRAGRLVPLRRAVGPWAASVSLAVLIALLMRAPGLRFKDLALRFLDPAAGVPPVTTTQLDVSPGDHDLLQSQPLTINIQATHLGDSPLILRLSDDGIHWAKVTMTPDGGGRFAFTLASVDHDLHYRVTGGDAQTPNYLIRVLRKPSVARFLIQYQYPAYARLQPAAVTNSDGHIEAPAGTRATLTVTATEPLREALLTVDGEKVLMASTPDPYSRKYELIVRNDGKYWLDLISTREVPGAGPAGMSIKALPDLPPQVRLARGGESLRLNPRDILPLSYDALDDYGLAALVVRAQINAQPPITVPVRLWGDARRQQEVFNFDLATLPLGIGDVLTLTLLATDTSGHESASEPLHVVISPRSVDLDTYERISELNNAAQLAQSLTGQMDDASKAQDEADAQKDHSSSAYLSAAARGDRSLTAAAQTATLLRQALLRAITHSRSPELSTALASWVDQAEVESAAAEDAFRQSGAAAGMAGPDRERLRHAADQGRQLHFRLWAVAQGEQARAVLADRENLKASEGKAEGGDENAKHRRQETLQRMRQDLDGEVAQLGLEAKADNLDDQLRGRIAAGDEAARAAGPVDFTAAAREWSQQMQRDPQQRLGLESRLSAAAQAEAIRPDSDLLLARDLELASRAVAAVTASARSGGSKSGYGTFNALVSDLQALQHDRELRKADAAGHSPQELELAARSAAKARQDLAQWAGNSEAFAAATASSSRGAATAADRQRDVEDLAMQASAAAANHQYDQAEALDRAMAARLEGKTRREGGAAAPSAVEIERAATTGRIDRHREAVRREMTMARRLDDLDRQQRQLSGRTTGSAGVAALASGQHAVAERIAQVDRQRADGPAVLDSRNAAHQATVAVLAVEEQLAAMPQALADAQAAASARRDAAGRADAARKAVETAAPQQRDAARRAADQSARDVRDADQGLRHAMSPVTPDAALELAGRLEPLVPEATVARAVILSQLLPALQSLQQTLPTGDSVAGDRAAASARQAIEAAQRELAVARDVLVRHDPLMAARWLARAAVDSLSLRPPDIGRARRQQADVSAALNRAWDQSIHRAAAERLSQVPTLAAVLGPPVPADKSATSGAASVAKFPAAREWGRLRAQDGPDINTTLHDTDPPGYEESLQLYFEGLNKARGGK